MYDSYKAQTEHKFKFNKIKLLPSIQDVESDQN